MCRRRQPPNAQYTPAQKNPARFTAPNSRNCSREDGVVFASKCPESSRNQRFRCISQIFVAYCKCRLLHQLEVNGKPARNASARTHAQTDGQSETYCLRSTSMIVGDIEKLQLNRWCYDFSRHCFWATVRLRSLSSSNILIRSQLVRQWRAAAAAYQYCFLYDP